MQDMINAFKAHLYERASNPFLGTFAFYWLIFNYKLVIVLIDSELKAGEKFELIKTLYPQEVYNVWIGFDLYYYTLLGNGLLLPLIITLLYIFIAPYPIRFIYEFWKNKQKELLEIKQKIDDDTPLTKEQSKKIRQEILNLEIEYENSFKRKDEEIYQLKEMLKVKDSELETKQDDGITLNPISPEYRRDNFPFNQVQNEYRNKRDELKMKFINDASFTIQDKILYLIGEYGDNTHSSTISNYLGIPPIVVEDEAMDLINKQYVTIDESMKRGNEHPYVITNLGKDYLMKLIKNFREKIGMEKEI